MVSNYGGKRAQPRTGGYQLFAWYFLRVSGVALLFLVLGHIFITHYLNLPFETTFGFVVGRYVSVFWRTFDWLLLSIALVHGTMIGVQYSIEDYVHSRRARLLILSVLYAVVFAFLALGSVNILVFQPSAAVAPAGTANEPMWLATVMDGLLVLVAVVTYLGTAGILLWIGRAWARGLVYYGGWGQLAWILHRAAGLGIAFFLLVHILDIVLINVSPAVYDETVSFYQTPFLIPMEIALVGAVVYHALNGLRVIALDLWVGALRRQGELFLAVLALTVLLVAPSAILLIFR